MPGRPDENENCLAGMRCPCCVSLGPFNIQAECVVEMHDDGSEHAEQFDWTEDGSCSCKNCSFVSLVREFKKTKQAYDALGTKPPPKALPWMLALVEYDQDSLIAEDGPDARAALCKEITAAARQRLGDKVTVTPYDD